MVQGLKHELLWQKTRAQFLTPTSGGSQPTTATVSRDPVSSSGLLGSVHLHVHISTHTHNLKANEVTTVLTSD